MILEEIKIVVNSLIEYLSYIFPVAIALFSFLLAFKIIRLFVTCFEGPYFNNDFEEDLEQEEIEPKVSESIINYEEDSPIKNLY